MLFCDIHQQSKATPDIIIYNCTIHILWYQHHCRIQLVARLTNRAMNAMIRGQNVDYYVENHTFPAPGSVSYCIVKVSLLSLNHLCSPAFSLHSSAVSKYGCMHLCALGTSFRLPAATSTFIRSGWSLWFLTSVCAFIRIPDCRRFT